MTFSEEQSERFFESFFYYSGEVAPCNEDGLASNSLIRGLWGE